MDNRDIKVGGVAYRHDLFEFIVSPENLFSAWQEFKRGKEDKLDVQRFSYELEDNIFKLSDDLIKDRYKHGSYQSFFLYDPKLRHIHKAEVRDRVLHHSVVRAIEPIFEPTFIYDSYSSRKLKGSHRSVQRLRDFGWHLSRNNTRTVYMLQCDVKKFFDSVNHNTLLDILKQKIKDSKVTSLLERIIWSLETSEGAGIPLGNLTSQLFSNIYLNPFDQYVKRSLRVQWYIRYADDFVICSHEPSYLLHLIPKLQAFLRDRLRLEIHRDKIKIRKWHQGIDFLGYVSFPYHTIIRPKTKKRIFRKLKRRLAELKRGEIDDQKFRHIIASYLGILDHCRGEAIRGQLQDLLENSL